MKPQEVISKILKTSHDKAKKDRPILSIRYLAQRLKLSSSYVHQILKGQRLAKPEVYKKLCKLLDIENEKKEFILNQAYQGHGLLVDEEASLQKEDFRGFSPSVSWNYAPRSAFKFLKSWKYIAILEATMLGRYDGSAKFIADELGLDEQEVENILGMLHAEKFLAMTDGKLRKNHRLLDFSSAHSKHEIREYHLQNLKLAQDCLEVSQTDEDVEKRLIASFQFVCKKSEVILIRQRLTEFFQMLATDFAVNDGDEIYQFGAQLFPLEQSRRKRRSKKD